MQCSRSIKSALAASMWPQAPRYFSRPSEGSSVKKSFVSSPASGCSGSSRSAAVKLVDRAGASDGESFAASDAPATNTVPTAS